jgi:hypothetical protein
MCSLRFKNNCLTIERVRFASKIISLLSNVFASLRYRSKHHYRSCRLLLFRYPCHYYCRCLLLNPFLFIRGLSCPSSVQASLTQNCLKLTIPGFPYNCLSVSCGDISFKKNPRSCIGLEIKPQIQIAFTSFLTLLPSANFLLSDLVGRDSPLQIVMAVWPTIIVSRGLSHLTQKIQIKTKSVPNCHYYLQRAVIPDWKGGIAL